MTEQQKELEYAWKGIPKHLRELRVEAYQLNDIGLTEIKLPENAEILDVLVIETKGTATLRGNQFPTWELSGIVLCVLQNPMLPSEEKRQFVVVVGNEIVSCDVNGGYVNNPNRLVHLGSCKFGSRLCHVFEILEKPRSYREELEQLREMQKRMKERSERIKERTSQLEKELEE